MTTVCCVCNKTKKQAGWVKQRPQEKTELSHGYCPACFHKIMKKINEYSTRLHAAVQP